MNIICIMCYFEENLLSVHVVFIVQISGNCVLECNYSAVQVRNSGFVFLRRRLLLCRVSSCMSVVII